MVIEQLLTDLRDELGSIEEGKLADQPFGQGRGQRAVGRSQEIFVEDKSPFALPNWVQAPTKICDLVVFG